MFLEAQLGIFTKSPGYLKRKIKD